MCRPFKKENRHNEKRAHMLAEGRPEYKLTVWSRGEIVWGQSRSEGCARSVRPLRESTAVIIQIAEGVLIKPSKTEPHT